MKSVINWNDVFQQLSVNDDQDSVGIKGTVSFGSPVELQQMSSLFKGDDLNDANIGRGIEFSNPTVSDIGV